MEPELALALSARRWSDELRRFVADHGGARVRVTALGSEDLRDESFDVLIVDDICSFLTPRLVADVQAAGRAIVGVYDAGEFPEGREALGRLGIGHVIESDAPPDRFLSLVADAAGPDTERNGRRGVVPASDVDFGSRRRLVVVTGAGGGCGVTETAIGLADSLARDGRSVVLVDGDALAPSVGQRLGLALHPNVATAVDLWEQRTGSAADALQSRHGLPVLVGMPGPVEWRAIRPIQLKSVIDDLGRSFRHVVVDLGNRPDPEQDISSSLVELADVVVCVCAPTPIGVARLVSWRARQSLGDRPRLDVAVNRAPRDPFKRGELIDEISSGVEPEGLVFLPEDPAVAAAAWDGRLVGRGRFRSAIERLAGSAERSVA